MMLASMMPKCVVIVSSAPSPSPRILIVWRYYRHCAQRQEKCPRLFVWMSQASGFISRRLDVHHLRLIPNLQDARGKSLQGNSLIVMPRVRRPAGAEAERLIADVDDPV